MIEAAPSWELLFAIACAVGIVPAFALFGRCWPNLGISVRLKIAILSMMCLWGLVVLAAMGGGFVIRAIDVIASAAILFSAAICSFLVVSVFAWGFTITMLDDLANSQRSVTLEEWKNAFGGGIGFAAFCRDRLGLLTAGSMVAVRDHAVTLTGKGILVSSIAKWLMIYFAVPIEGRHE